MSNDIKDIISLIKFKSTKKKILKWNTKTHRNCKIKKR